MIEVKGKYNSAKIFAGKVEGEAIEQIETLLNQEFVSGSTVRIMPDVHSGVGCTIGTTMTVKDKVVPNLVGVDIGCGMETAILKDTRVELARLDKVVNENIPAGFEVRERAHQFIENIDLTELRAAKHVNLSRAELSMGTLGGGNHFIELDRDDEGRLYLVVHSGSRNLGKQIAQHYQDAAVRELERNTSEIERMVAELKDQGRESEIQGALKKLTAKKVNRALAYAEGRLMEDYLHDMAIVQRYAELNRQAIIGDIVKKMKLKVSDKFTTVHNYIDLDSMILRKGAISARAGERVLIPINMRDGSLICVGKGNPDWNYSAPHGAGRIMGRRQARESISLSQFTRSMEGIYSSTVNKSTVDEAPFVYKPIEEITEHITDTVDIVARIRPVYNFKAAEQD